MANCLLTAAILRRVSERMSERHDKRWTMLRRLVSFAIRQPGGIHPGNRRHHENSAASSEQAFPSDSVLKQQSIEKDKDPDCICVRGPWCREVVS